MEQNEEKKETREIYDLNPLFIIIFKKLKSRWRFFIITIILLALILIPGIYFDSLYFPEEELVGTLEGTTFISILITILSLVLMEKVYKKFKETFREVKKISKIDDESQYQDMLYKYNTPFMKK